MNKDLHINEIIMNNENSVDLLGKKRLNVEDKEIIEKSKIESHNTQDKDNLEYLKFKNNKIEHLPNKPIISDEKIELENFNKPFKPLKNFEEKESEYINHQETRNIMESYQIKSFEKLNNGQTLQLQELNGIKDSIELKKILKSEGLNTKNLKFNHDQNYNKSQTDNSIVELSMKNKKKEDKALYDNIKLTNSPILNSLFNSEISNQKEESNSEKILKFLQNKECFNKINDIFSNFRKSIGVENSLNIEKNNIYENLLPNNNSHNFQFIKEQTINTTEKNNEYQNLYLNNSNGINIEDINCIYDNLNLHKNISPNKQPNNGDFKIITDFIFNKNNDIIDNNFIINKQNNLDYENCNHQINVLKSPKNQDIMIPNTSYPQNSKNNWQEKKLFLNNDPITSDDKKLNVAINLNNNDKNSILKSCDVCKFKKQNIKILDNNFLDFLSFKLNDLIDCLKNPNHKTNNVNNNNILLRNREFLNELKEYQQNILSYLENIKGKSDLNQSYEYNQLYASSEIDKLTNQNKSICTDCIDLYIFKPDGIKSLYEDLNINLENMLLLKNPSEENFIFGNYIIPNNHEINFRNENSLTLNNNNIIDDKNFFLNTSKNQDFNSNDNIYQNPNIDINLDSRSLLNNNNSSNNNKNNTNFLYNKNSNPNYEEDNISNQIYTYNENSLIKQNFEEIKDSEINEKKIELCRDGIKVHENNLRFENKTDQKFIKMENNEYNMKNHSKIKSKNKTFDILIKNSNSILNNSADNNNMTSDNPKNDLKDYKILNIPKLKKIIKKRTNIINMLLDPQEKKKNEDLKNCEKNNHDLGESGISDTNKYTTNLFSFDFNKNLKEANFRDLFNMSSKNNHIDTNHEFFIKKHLQAQNFENPKCSSHNNNNWNLNRNSSNEKQIISSPSELEIYKMDNLLGLNTNKYINFQKEQEMAIPIENSYCNKFSNIENNILKNSINHINSNLSLNNLKNNSNSNINLNNPIFNNSNNLINTNNFNNLNNNNLLMANMNNMNQINQLNQLAQLNAQLGQINPLNPLNPAINNGMANLQGISQLYPINPFGSLPINALNLNSIPGYNLNFDNPTLGNFANLSNLNGLSSVQSGIPNLQYLNSALLSNSLSNLDPNSNILFNNNLNNNTNNLLNNQNSQNTKNLNSSNHKDIPEKEKNNQTDNQENSHMHASQFSNSVIMNQHQQLTQQNNNLNNVSLPKHNNSINNSNHFNANLNNMNNNSNIQQAEQNNNNYNNSQNIINMNPLSLNNNLIQNQNQQMIRNGFRDLNAGNNFNLQNTIKTNNENQNNYNEQNKNANSNYNSNLNNQQHNLINNNNYCQNNQNLNPNNNDNNSNNNENKSNNTNKNSSPDPHGNKVGVMLEDVKSQSKTIIEFIKSQNKIIKELFDNVDNFVLKYYSNSKKSEALIAGLLKNVQTLFNICPNSKEAVEINSRLTVYNKLINFTGIIISYLLRYLDDSRKLNETLENSIHNGSITKPDNIDLMKDFENLNNRPLFSLIDPVAGGIGSNTLNINNLNSLNNQDVLNIIPNQLMMPNVNIQGNLLNTLSQNANQGTFPNTALGSNNQYVSSNGINNLNSATYGIGSGLNINMIPNNITSLGNQVPTTSGTNVNTQGQIGIQNGNLIGLNPNLGLNLMNYQNLLNQVNHASQNQQMNLYENNNNEFK